MSSNVLLSPTFMMEMFDSNIDTDDECCDNTADTAGVLIESPGDLRFDSRNCLFV